MDNSEDSHEWLHFYICVTASEMLDNACIVNLIHDTILFCDGSIVGYVLYFPFSE